MEQNCRSAIGDVVISTHLTVAHPNNMSHFADSRVAMGWAGWSKSRGPPSEGAPSSRQKGARDKVTKRRRGKERVEWGRGPWRAVLAFLPRGPRVPSYATDCRVNKERFPRNGGGKIRLVLR